MTTGILGELIRRRRLEVKMTQAELAKQIGVQHSYISKIERGAQRGSYEKLAAISLILGIPWKEMMKTGQVKIPQMIVDDSFFPYVDEAFVKYHPKLKAMLYDIAPILEKYL